MTALAQNQATEELIWNNRAYLRLWVRSAARRITRGKNGERSSRSRPLRSQFISLSNKPRGGVAAPMAGASTKLLIFYRGEKNFK